MAGDDRQHIVEIVGDATGHLAQRLHFLRMAQLLLEQGSALNGELAFFNVRFQLVVGLLQFDAGLVPVEGEFDGAKDLAILEGFEHIGEGFGRLGSL